MSFVSRIIFLLLALGISSRAFAEASFFSLPRFDGASLDSSIAEESHRVETFRVGHNVSATSDVLGRGQCSVGVQVFACGVTNRFTMGSSPWLVKDYRMVSLGMRYLLSDSEEDRWSAQSTYFKSFKKRNVAANLNDDYQMEALWMMLIHTLKLEKHYKLHINFHANYYFDDKMPFSLRRPYINPSPWQLNFTTLHEMELTAGWFAFVEMGALDILNAPIHGHIGSSIGRRMGRLSAHLGLSVSGTYDGFFTTNKRADYQQYLRWRSYEGYRSTLDPEMVQYDYALHPEFTIQYLF